MIDLIITLINARLTAWGRLVTNYGLCELREDGDGKTWPMAYTGAGEFSAVEIDSGSLTYLRLTGSGPNDERVTIPYVAGDQRQITYPLRLVAIAHRSDFPSPLALADELGNILNGASDDIDQLQTGITSNVTVTNKEARTPTVFGEEFQGIDDHDLQYNRCMVAVEFSVQVTGPDECWPDPCQTDIDILTLFNFCDKSVRDRLTPEQIECLTDALCETPPTLCEQLADVAPEDVVTDVFDCLTPEAQDELISEVCPPCDQLTITFNGETITTIDEPCGETVALTCSTLTASAYVEDGNPVTGAYHPDGTLNGKTKYTKDVTHYLFYNGTEWELEKQGANETATAGNENFPWLATWPTITVTQANIGEACCECASGEVVVTNSDGDPIATIDVPSGVTVPYEIPDVDWTDSDGSPQSTPYGAAIVCTPCTAPSLAVSTSNAAPSTGGSVTITATATGFAPTSYRFMVFNGSLYDLATQVGNAYNWTVNLIGTFDVHVLATDGTVSAWGKTTVTATGDADAMALIAADSITDQTTRMAIHNAIVGLKAGGVWSKIDALWMNYGSSPTANKWNAKNPLDTNAAFRLVYSGGVTHLRGTEPNGVNGWADTFYNLATSAANWHTDHHIAICMLSQPTVGAGWQIGCGNTATGNPIYGLAIRRASGNLNDVFYDVGNISGGGRIFIGSTTDARGFWIGNCANSTDRRLYRNAVELGGSLASVTGTPPNATFHIGRMNPTSGSSVWLGGNIGLASVGRGLTVGEIAAYNTVNTNFQLALARNTL